MDKLIEVWSPVVTLIRSRMECLYPDIILVEKETSNIKMSVFKTFEDAQLFASWMGFKKDEELLITFMGKQEVPGLFDVRPFFTTEDSIIQSRQIKRGDGGYFDLLDVRWLSSPRG